MLTSSKKSKGHRLESLVRDRVIEAFDLDPQDIRIPISGEHGHDIIISGAKAKARAPFGIECKAWEKFKMIYDIYMKAAERDKKLVPLVVIKSNHKQPLVILDLDHFLTLIRK